MAQGPAGTPEPWDAKPASERVRPVLRSRWWMTAPFALGVAIGFAVTPDSGTSSPLTVAALPAVSAPPPGEPAATPAEPAPAPVEEVAVAEPARHELRPRETVAAALAGHGISAGETHSITRAMRPLFDFRRARPGDRYRLERAPDGSLVAFFYERSPLDVYEARRGEKGWEAHRAEPALARHRTRLAGVVTSNLYDAVQTLGEQASLADDFTAIFAWDLDFSRDVRRGDEFSILYERLFLEREGEEPLYVRPGRILAARYTTRGRVHRAVYFEREEGHGDYYRPDGSAVERSFLKAPLEYRRISSHYAATRLHPVLKVRRPHFAIDYAAPVGTPVWSVADGEVIFRGRVGGFGNLVKIRHEDGHVSYYGHLSRFVRDLRVGQRVQQKQVIGFVGQTGLATGPHLDFRMQRNGKYVNPSFVRIASTRPISRELRVAFSGARDALLHELEPSSLVVTNEAL
jgi:murein DD-endopeptidase MepM/ murein hydrolase activator NlpD